MAEHAIFDDDTVAVAILAAVEPGILPGGNAVQIPEIAELQAQGRAAGCAPFTAARMVAATVAGASS